LEFAHWKGTGTLQRGERLKSDADSTLRFVASFLCATNVLFSFIFILQQFHKPLWVESLSYFLYFTNVPLLLSSLVLPRTNIRSGTDPEGIAAAVYFLFLAVTALMLLKRKEWSRRTHVGIAAMQSSTLLIFFVINVVMVFSVEGARRIRFVYSLILPLLALIPGFVAFLLSRDAIKTLFRK
jgi:hypothetical protein